MKNKSRKPRKSKNGFTKVPNAILYDNELTTSEKGLLAELISNPPDWKTRQKELFGRSADGYPVQKRALLGLIEMGFIEQIRKNRDDGKFEYEYPLNTDMVNGRIAKKVSPSVEGDVTSKPEGEPVIGKPVTDKPVTDKPHTVNPITVKPDTVTPGMENCPNSNTDSLSNTDGSNTDLNNTKVEKEERKANASDNMPGNGSEFNPPLLEEVKAYFESIGSDAKAAFAFFQEFSQRQWFTVKGDKVTNWKGMANYSIKNKSYTASEMSMEEKALISEVGNSLYRRIYNNVYNSLPESEKIYAARVNKSEVTQCLFQACLNNKIYTYKALMEYLGQIKLNLNSMAEYKKCLGLNSSGTGKKHY
ncbi:MAG: hypothetical protein ACK50A_02275 [Sphingobacteriaceae bacterium]